MVVSGAIGALGLAPPAAHVLEPLQVILPIGGFFEMVVDLDHLHVFVTGDPSLNNSRVVAVDYRGERGQALPKRAWSRRDGPGPRSLHPLRGPSGLRTPSQPSTRRR